MIPAWPQLEVFHSDNATQAKQAKQAIEEPGVCRPKEPEEPEEAKEPEAAKEPEEPKEPE